MSKKKADSKKQTAEGATAAAELISEVKLPVTIEFPHRTSIYLVDGHRYYLRTDEFTEVAVEHLQDLKEAVQKDHEKNLETKEQ